LYSKGREVYPDETK